MTGPRPAEDRIAMWLEEEANGVLPDRVLDAAFERTRALRQARRSAWRPFTMSRPIPAMVAAGAAAIVIVAGVMVLRPSPTSNVGGSPPSASPTTSATPTASPSPSPTPAPLDTSAWTTYVSDRYGFSIAYPADWLADSADHDWTFAADVDWLSTGAEAFFTSVNEGIRMTAWSVATEPGTTLDEWLQAYCPLTMVNTDDKASDCPATIAQQRPATMDGHAGVLVVFPTDTQAFFQVGDRLYVVAVWRPETDPSVARYSGTRRLVEAAISTMRLLPAGPAPSAATASPS